MIQIEVKLIVSAIAAAVVYAVKFANSFDRRHLSDIPAKPIDVDSNIL